MLLKNTETPFGKGVCGLDASVRQGVPPAVAKGRVRDPHLAEQTPAGTPISRGIIHGQKTVEHVHSMDGA